MTAPAPVLVLKLYYHGGVGVVRTLGRMGVPVYVVHDDSTMPAARSRYIKSFFEHDLDAVAAADSVGFLAEVADRIGSRPILIASDDTAEKFVADNADALRERFSFPAAAPGLSQRLFSKRGLYELCLEHGVPTPACSFPQSRAEAAEAIAAARYPLVLKPIDNVRFARRNGIRMKIVSSAAEAGAAYDELEDPEDPNIMLQEYIPGDSRSVWVFTGYFDADSELLFGAGGLKLRQYPIHTGTTCYGVIHSIPEMEAVTSRFAKDLGYRGVFDCGYRYDPRDGQYKMLDVNPRVGANFRQCVGRDGLDVVRAMYLDLSGEPVPADPPDEGRHWWVENYDLLAGIGLAREGSLSFGRWLRSIREVDEPGWFAHDDLAPFRRLVTRSLGSAFRKTVGGRRTPGAAK